MMSESGFGFEIYSLRLRPTDPWRAPPNRIIVPLEKWRGSKDENFWVCLKEEDGRLVVRTGNGGIYCAFQPDSGQ